MKKLIQQAGVISALFAAAGPGLASPTPVAPTHNALPLTPSAVPAPAQAAPGASSPGLLYASVTPDQIAGLLHAKGFKAEVHTIPNVGPVIGSATNGINYLIFFYGCGAETAPACKAVQFVAIWTNTSGFTIADANKCNDKTVFGKLVGYPEKVILSHAAGMVGASDRFFEEQLNIWDGSIMVAQQCFAESRHVEPPAKGDATPHAAIAPLQTPPALAGQTPASVSTSAVPPAEFNPMPR